jgi:hypothetical protein
VLLASTTSILPLSADACRPDQHIGSEAARSRVGASGQLGTADAVGEAGAVPDLRASVLRLKLGG